MKTIVEKIHEIKQELADLQTQRRGLRSGIRDYEERIARLMEEDGELVARAAELEKIAGYLESDPTVSMALHSNGVTPHTGDQLAYEDTDHIEEEEEENEEEASGEAEEIDEEGTWAEYMLDQEDRDLMARLCRLPFPAQKPLGTKIVYALAFLEQPVPKAALKEYLLNYDPRIVSTSVDSTISRMIDRGQVMKTYKQSAQDGWLYFLGPAWKTALL